MQIYMKNSSFQAFPYLSYWLRLSIEFFRIFFRSRLNHHTFFDSFLHSHGFFSNFCSNSSFTAVLMSFVVSSLNSFKIEFLTSVMISRWALFSFLLRMRPLYSFLCLYFSLIHRIFFYMYMRQSLMYWF